MMSSQKSTGLPQVGFVTKWKITCSLTASYIRISFVGRLRIVRVTWMHVRQKGNRSFTPQTVPLSKVNS